MERVRRLKAMLCGLAGLAALVCPGAPAIGQSLPDCWTVTYAALKHRAASAHPMYITYNEIGSISQDELTLMRVTPSVIYRDDGILRVTDNGFSYLTRDFEPGPPELGPYGNRRSMWLPIDESADPSLPVIGTVRTRNATMTCITEDVEWFKGHQTYRILFTSQFADRAHLKSLWVDTTSSEIWKVIVTAAAPVSMGEGRKSPMADYEIELTPIGGYVVVDHVTWKFSYHQFWQTTNFFGEYYYTAYEFPKELPVGFFHT